MAKEARTKRNAAFDVRNAVISANWSKILLAAKAMSGPLTY